MAERRMFTQKIIDSDAFLDMGLSAQALYFHLNMRADDDGFINNPKKIMRMINASEDDLRLLITKRFLLTFDSGVIVIKHWRMHNLIRRDRYHPTQYQEEMESLCLKENGAYTEQDHQLETTWKPSVNQMETKCQPDDTIDGTDMATQIRQGKISIGKPNIDISPSVIPKEFDELWDIYPVGRKQGKKKALEAYRRARKAGTTFEEVKEGIESYVRYIKENKIETKFVKQAGTFFQQNAWTDVWSTSQDQDDPDGLDGIL